MVITGAASGMGNQLARLALQQGHSVLAIDSDTAAFAQLNCYANAGQLTCERIDVRDNCHWQLLEQRIPEIWPQFDLMLNVAQVLLPGQIENQVALDIDYHLDTNAKGVILGTQMAARLMLQQGFGHVINVASAASTEPSPGLSLYSAAEFAVRGYSLAAAAELRAGNVFISLVKPALGGSANSLSQAQLALAILTTVLKQKPIEFKPAARRMHALGKKVRRVAGTINENSRETVAWPANVFPLPARGLGESGHANWPASGPAKGADKGAGKSPGKRPAGGLQSPQQPTAPAQRAPTPR